MTKQSSTHKAHKRAARAYAKKHGVKYTQALRAVASDHHRSPLPSEPGDGRVARTGVVIGAAGAGKTTLALKQTYENALRGVTQFVWDPYDIYHPALTDPGLTQPLDPHRVKVVRIPGRNLSLDPFLIAGPHPAQQMAEANRLLGWLTQDHLRPPHIPLRGAPRLLLRLTILTRALEIVMNQSDAAGSPPALLDVLPVLRRWGSGDPSDMGHIRADLAPAWGPFSHSLHQHLDTIRTTDVGAVIFRRAPEVTAPLDVTPGDLIIFATPTVAMTPVVHEHPPAHIGDAVIDLLGMYIETTLTSHPLHPCAVLLDEHPPDHAIGRWPNLHRIGRATGCSFTLLTRDAHAFETQAPSWGVGPLWCGNARSEEDAAASCRLLGMPNSRRNISRLLSLSPGEFLFRADDSSEITAVERTFPPSS